jgi:hypothetical protein
MRKRKMTFKILSQSSIEMSKISRPNASKRSKALKTTINLRYWKRYKSKSKRMMIYNLRYSKNLRRFNTILKTLHLKKWRILKIYLEMYKTFKFKTISLIPQKLISISTICILKNKMLKKLKLVKYKANRSKIKNKKWYQIKKEDFMIQK